jgi:hypothetical protein
VPAEPEGSSPHSQQPANDPYPEPGESTPHPLSQCPWGPFDPILPSILWSLEWALFFRLSHQNPVQVSPPSHACHMPCPPHSSLFYLPNNIWWWQITKLPIVQLPPLSHYFIHVRSKCSAEHFVLKQKQYFHNLVLNKSWRNLCCCMWKAYYNEIKSDPSATQ